MPLLLDRLAFGGSIEWLTASERDAIRFGRIWQQELGRKWATKFRWLVHAIRNVNCEFNVVPGNLRQATDIDRPLVSNWAEMYGYESSSPINVPNFLLRKLAEGNLHIWDAGGPKTLMAISGKTPKVARISAVFTPDEFRGRGFAKAGVSALCGYFLNQDVESCMLMDK